MKTFYCNTITRESGEANESKIKNLEEQHKKINKFKYSLCSCNVRLKCNNKVDNDHIKTVRKIWLRGGGRF